MRVLVMGGSQFNGFALVKELVRTGHEVTVLNRGKTEAPLPASVRRLVCDRTDHARLRGVLEAESFDVVHDVSAYHPEDVELMIGVFRGRIEHYIFASSTVIYAPSEILPITETFPVERGPSQIEYGLHKLLCEDRLVRAHREDGFPATTVAYSMVFGPRNILPDREQRMFLRLALGRPILVPGDGATLGQVGHVDDQARALRQMMGVRETFGKRYNLTGDQAYTRAGYVDTFAAVTGREPEVVHIPAERMEALWDGEERLELGRPTQARVDIRQSDEERKRGAAMLQRFQLSQLVQHVAPNLHRWNRSTVFGIDRLRAEIGWQPEYTFHGMVEQTWEWMRHEGLDRSLEFDWTFEDQLLATLGAR